MKKKQVDLGNVVTFNRGNYADTIKAITNGGFCPFCERNLSKHHPRPILFKGKYWLVTENNWPYEGSKHHLLFIARTHIEKTEKLTTPMWAELQSLYKKVVHKYKLKGATLFIRSGDTAFTGASVTHLHGHVVTGGKRTKNAKALHAMIGFKA